MIPGEIIKSGGIDHRRHLPLWLVGCISGEWIPGFGLLGGGIFVVLWCTFFYICMLRAREGFQRTKYLSGIDEANFFFLFLFFSGVWVRYLLTYPLAYPYIMTLQVSHAIVPVFQMINYRSWGWGASSSS